MTYETASNSMIPAKLAIAELAKHGVAAELRGDAIIARDEAVARDGALIVSEKTFPLLCGMVRGGKILEFLGY